MKIMVRSASFSTLASVRSERVSKFTRATRSDQAGSTSKTTRRTPLLRCFAIPSPLDDATVRFIYLLLASVPLARRP
jgi:hypothetical protein